MAERLKKGLFITFEGGEGSGKSTHSLRLFEDLLSEGYQAIRTLEPGGTPLGKLIRELILKKDEVRLNAWAELLLFEADRNQHVEEVIAPALEAGKIVICDRFNAATFAYQGYGLGMDMDLIEKVDEAARLGLSPDLTILMDVDVETGLERAKKKSAPDRMEKRNLDFHQEVRKGYLLLAEKYPEIIKIVKVKESVNETYDLVKKEADDLIARHKRTE